jgi:hypothetical protein
MSQAPATAAAVESVNPADADRSATTATVELPAWLEAGCQQLTEWLPNLLPPDRCDDLYVGLLGDAIWHLPTVLLLLLSLLWGLVRWLGGGRQRRRSASVTADGLETTGERLSPIGWLSDRLLARRRARRYLRALADTTTLKRQPVFGAEPRARRGYEVPLKVADDHLTGQPETPPPLTASGMPLVSGRAVTLPETLTDQQPDGRRLLIPGEPGAGKSTLLAGLALSMAERDPDNGPFARALVPNRLANALEGLRRRLDGLSVSETGALAGLAALLLWVIGIFVSGAPVTQLLLALVWLVAGFPLLGRGQFPLPGRGGFQVFPVGFGLAMLVLGYAWLGLTPVWAPAAWSNWRCAGSSMTPRWSACGH